MNTTLLKTLLRGSLTLGCAFSAIAQDDVTPITPAADLTAADLTAAESASAADSATTTDLGETVILASRAPRHVDTAPAALTVLTRADIDASTARNVTELLGRQGGVYVRDLYGNGSKVSVGMLGMGNGETDGLNTVIVVDGIRATYSDLASYNWTAIPLDQVERIEIRRGGGGSLYGAGATGGVINITTRRAAGRSVTAGVEVDSYGYSTRLSLGWAQDGWSALIQDNYLDSRGYRTNSEHRNHTDHVSLSYRPSEGPFSFDLQAGIQEEEAGLPGDLTPAQIASMGPRASDSPTDDFEQETSYIAFIPRVRLGDGHEFQLGMNWNDRHTDSTLLFFGSPYRSADHQTLWSLSPQYTWTGELGDRANTLTIGMDYTAADLNAIENRTDSSQYLREYFIHNSLEVLPDVYFDAGYRYAQVDNSFAGLGKPEQDLDAFDFGLAWNYADDSKVFASYGQAYRIPVLDEYKDFSTFPTSLSTDLVPQTTTTAQVGVRHHFHDYFVPSVTLFHSRSDNEILYDPTAGSYGANANYDTVERYGAILEVESKPCEAVRLTANYTYLEAEFGANGTSSTFDGNRVPMTPRHRVTAQAEVDLSHGFSLTADWQWTGTQVSIGDMANSTDDIPGHSVVNTRLTYTYKWLTVYGGVENLLDEAYYEYASYGTSIYSSPERTFVGGLVLKFDY